MLRGAARTEADGLGAASIGLVLLAIASPVAAFDLSRGVTDTLPNGLRVLVLEDRNFPVVSVQMLYTVGARDEESGRTGLAHFLEHMAFRASEHFPETDVVSRIYAVGGEWHGYTWIDQTTYFATAPREHLDLLLAIEADRMAKLLISPPEVEPERGAVLAELHSYENDPASVLYDAVVAASFVAHPYRNNTIGWVSDVEKITVSDLRDFYRRHYRPANAVLAVVGDVSAAAVLRRVRARFDGLRSGGRTPLPRTVEPPQMGLRRVELEGAGSASRFAIAYSSPAAAGPDWPAFLLLREVLAGGAGVNFRQEDFGVPVREGTRLASVEAELTSWLPPTALPYVLALAGSVERTVAPADLEAAIEARVAVLRDAPVPTAELAAARRRLLADLVFDLETTEDAAHQLAFFEGLDARDALVGLPARLAAVTPEELKRVALRYLQPWQRTIGWFRAGRPKKKPAAGPEAAPASAASPRPDAGPAPGGAGTGPTAGSVPSAAAAPVAPGSPPEVRRLPAGLPVFLAHVPASPAVFVRVLVPASRAATDATATVDDPLWRHTSLDFRGLKQELRDLLAAARAALKRTAPAGAVPSPSEDPAERLEETLRALLGIAPTRVPRAPALVVVAGDLADLPVWEWVKRHFGDVAPGSLPAAPAPAVRERERTVSLAGLGKAQAQLGYAAPAPPPGHPDHLAWRVLLYILTHDYQGRLGEEAIGRRGLLYYVGSRYHTDGVSGWISLTMGVDPAKLAPLRTLVAETLAGLAADPPSEAEVAEAKQHLLGRRLSAHQSNEEISAFLAREWIGRGRLATLEEFEAELARVSRADVMRIIPQFLAGATAVVEVD